MNSNVENLPPHVIRLVYKEVSALTADPPEGIKIFPNEEDITDLHATLEGPEGTPFAGGVFKMRLVLGKDFPATPPKGYFLTKIFHPNVGHNGEICVNVLKKDWKAELGIRHILLTIKCLLIHPNPESALNEEAGRLLLEDYSEYASRARLMTEIHAMGSSTGLSHLRVGTGVPGDGDSEDVGLGGATNEGGPQPKKHAGENSKRLNNGKKKIEKKRALRRL
ncbi:ubiquitin-conjugating enzyme E2 S [Polypterus senegalus]|uniref:ubiquitin-conjugating enzyme E2 S n=1 Tax=Polypterus senegalus TaxID=55291 RepID=UPI00196467B7|nr:ubiquitin-conjugating enzyme E2 S [Polypterus senegalus]